MRLLTEPRAGKLTGAIRGTGSFTLSCICVPQPCCGTRTTKSIERTQIAGNRPRTCLGSAAAPPLAVMSHTHTLPSAPGAASSRPSGDTPTWQRGRLAPPVVPICGPLPTYRTTSGDSTL